MPRFFPLMPHELTDIPAMVVIDTVKDVEKKFPDFLQKNLLMTKVTESASTLAGTTLKWQRFRVRFTEPAWRSLSGNLLIVSYEDRANDTGVAFIRTDVPGLLKALDDLFWNDMAVPPPEDEVVWVRNEFMESPCLASIGQYRAPGGVTESAQWCIEKDFTKIMPAPAGTLTRPSQWRSGFQNVEPFVPEAIERMAKGFALVYKEGEELTDGSVV